MDTVPHGLEFLGEIADFVYTVSYYGLLVTSCFFVLGVGLVFVLAGWSISTSPVLQLMYQRLKVIEKYLDFGLYTLPYLFLGFLGGVSKPLIEKLVLLITP